MSKALTTALLVLAVSVGGLAVGVSPASATLDTLTVGSQSATVFSVPGGTVTFPVSGVQSGTARAVSLTAVSGGPTGMTVNSFGSCVNTGDSTPSFTLGLTVPANTAPGTYTFTVTGTRWFSTSSCSGTV